MAEMKMVYGCSPWTPWVPGVQYDWTDMGIAELTVSKPTADCDSSVV